MVLFRPGYSTSEAFKHMGRNFGTSFGAVITIFLSLFIIGLFAMGTLLINNMIGSVEDRITVQAFISDDAEESAVSDFEDVVREWEGVDSVVYKSKEQALEEYKETMTSQNAVDAIAELDGVNPIPASIVIKLESADFANTVADSLISNDDFISICDEPDNPADSVQYGQETVEKLLRLASYIRIIAVGLVALLTFVAFIFINNTIRLSIMARKLEIGIMRLVGASNGFIRGPFIMEGIIQSVLGSVFAVAGIEAIRRFALPKITESLSFLNLTVSSTYMMYIYIAIIGIGLVIGLFASLIAMRRFLKV